MQPLPAHIVVTCPNCGYGNVFEQPYPYHAGYGDQGFLYNESGTCTLTWNSFDQDYVAVVGPRYPWALTDADRAAIEERLMPSPDGTRWMFKNPARCLHCGTAISGPMTETFYYLRYPCTVDRDVRSGWGVGLKDVLRRARAAAPWKMSDVWLGVIAAVVLTGIVWALAYVLVDLFDGPHSDLWVFLFSAVIELLLLVPVWWFVRHKRHAPLRALGFRRFKWAWIGVGIGLLISLYIFEGFYVTLLALLGFEMQRDMTPMIRELSTPWPLVFSVVILAPAAEETFFRGFVFNGLRARMDWWWAALISAALFGAAHLDPLFFIPAFASGFLFAFLYQRTDSIWPGMLLHFLVNAIAMSIAMATI